MKAMEVCNVPICELGEGIFWHPERGSFCWFDILGKKLYEQVGDEPVRVIDCPGNASAAARIDEKCLVVAVDDGLHILDMDSKSWERHLDVEAHNSVTRSNDSRVHPSGSFWFGTMGWNAEKEAGSIYHVSQGKLQLLYPNITIPNSICFTQDGATGYFADSMLNTVWRIKIDPVTGLPLGDREIFLQFEPGITPDGAVVDSDGNFWLALWGTYKVAAFKPDGSPLMELSLTASNVSCPAFGGENCSELRVTTALEHLDSTARVMQPDGGRVFKTHTSVCGQVEAIYKL
jgi:sugar lactone lactonase YvrE